MLKKIFLVTLLTVSLPTKTEFFTYKNTVRSLAIGMTLTATYLTTAIIMNKYPTLKGFHDLTHSEHQRIFEGFGIVCFGFATTALFAYVDNIK